jgi:hypothetical protein
MDIPPPADSTPRRFWLSVVSLLLALAALAACAWFLWQFDYGITLVFGGLLTAFLGSVLGGPASDPRQAVPNGLRLPRLRRFSGGVDRGATDAESGREVPADQRPRAAPNYSIENAIMVAGLIGMVLGAPRLIQIMFSR